MEHAPALSRLQPGATAPRRRVARVEVVRPRRLTAEARARLADELYAAHVQIFDGVDRRRFVSYVIDSAGETAIEIYRDTFDHVVGYCAHHVFDVDLDGRAIAVIRGEVGILPAYRGGTAPYRFVFRESLRAALRRPGRALYALATPIHPASFRQIVRFGACVWPSPGRRTPDEVRALALALAERFGSRPIAGRDPRVRETGWRTRESDGARRSWLASDDPAVRLFLELNPGYAEGHGLLTLVRLGAGDIVRSALRYVAASARASLGRARPPTPRP